MVNGFYVVGTYEINTVALCSEPLAIGGIESNGGDGNSRKKVIGIVSTLRGTLTCSKVKLLLAKFSGSLMRNGPSTVPTHIRPSLSFAKASTVFGV